MRKRLRLGARRHAHQCDDHTLALDAASEHAGIIRPTHDRIEPGEIEVVLARPRPLGAWGARRFRRSGIGLMVHGASSASNIARAKTLPALVTPAQFLVKSKTSWVSV